MERRLSPRKPLRVTARLTVSETVPMTVRTVDIGQFGMCVSGMARCLPVGQEVHVTFEMPHKGRLHEIGVSGRVSHCTDTAADGCKLGWQFVDSDSESMALLADYVRA